MTKARTGHIYILQYMLLYLAVYILSVSASFLLKTVVNMPSRKLNSVQTEVCIKLQKLKKTTTYIQHIKCIYTIYIYKFKGVIWCFLKIIIWCNRISWHALMFKKHIIFQMLYIIEVPLCPASVIHVIFYKAPPSDKSSLLWLANWPSALWLAEDRKCNSPFHNREL